LISTYGDKVTFTADLLSKDQFYGAEKNKPFKIEADGKVLYDRLNADGSNRPEADPNPSEDATALYGEKGGRVRYWGPIVPKEGNAWWGGPTAGKLQALHQNIDELIRTK